VAYSNTTGFPSSTQVIDPWINTEFFAPEDMERGTAVHESMTAHALGLWSPPLPEEWQPYFDSGRRWFDLMVERVLLVEKRLIDKGREYCGKPDLIAILKGDKEPSLVDYKTSQTIDKRRSPWPLQIASYRRLAEVDCGIICHRGLSVRLMKDGGAAKVDEHSNYARDLNVFIGMANAHNYFK
jgi:hypothetical protein